MPNSPVTRKDFSHFKKVLITFGCIISTGCAAGLFTVRHEANTRTGQFCNLIAGRYNASVDGLNGSVDFLEASKDKVLNRFIRERSVPQLNLQVKTDRPLIPEVCLGKYKLHTVKDPKKIQQIINANKH